MTNQEILEKAIQKAIDGGWIWMNRDGIESWRVLEDYAENQLEVTTTHHDKQRSQRYLPTTFIFNHDFAKALWGENWKSAELLDNIPKTDTYRIGTVEPCWAWHLKNMVIAEDPIAYLGENI